MLIGYVRVSKSDGSQVTDLQRDALIEAGVGSEYIYEDLASGMKDNRPGLLECIKALRKGDTLVVWRMDRLGRSLRHLINTVHDLNCREIGFRALTGYGSNINTSDPSGKLMFNLFASLAEFERDLIAERTIAGIRAARARGRIGGRSWKLTVEQVGILQESMKNPERKVRDLAREMGVSTKTIYKFVCPQGTLRPEAERFLRIQESKVA
jgi:DNA invertase Pin-like site-specific DNA recombinase